MMGEFRVHYAGFFDPGFGVIDGKPKGAKAVLEVRSLDIPFILEDGQTIGRLLLRAPGRYARGALRPGHGLQLPGPGPQARQALQVSGGRARSRPRHCAPALPAAGLTARACHRHARCRAAAFRELKAAHTRFAIAPDPTLRVSMTRRPENRRQFRVSVEASACRRHALSRAATD